MHSRGLTLNIYFRAQPLVIIHPIRDRGSGTTASKETAALWQWDPEQDEVDSVYATPRYHSGRFAAGWPAVPEDPESPIARPNRPSRWRQSGVIERDWREAEISDTGLPDDFTDKTPDAGKILRYSVTDI